jgi:hypothetical protein
VTGVQETDKRRSEIPVSRMLSMHGMHVDIQLISSLTVGVEGTMIVGQCGEWGYYPRAICKVFMLVSS